MAGPAYPLRASPNGRYLVDQNGTPQFFAADTAWDLLTRLSDAEAAQYLGARKNQGFNTILTSVVDTSSGIGGKNLAGQAPFNGDDIGSPNSAYFDHVDSVLRIAGELGMELIIAPSWLQLTVNSGSYTAANTSTYGKWLGARYQSFDNIIWMVGGDWGGAVAGSCPALAETRALATGIASNDSRHLITYHPGTGLASSTCYNDDSWLGINSNYWDFNYSNVSSAYRFMYRDYVNMPIRPTIMIETGYQGPYPTDPLPDALNARTSRLQSYDMVLAGAFGFTYGAQGTYDMVDGEPGRTWQQTLEIPGGYQQGDVHGLFTGLDWWKLVPDRTHADVTAGWGTFGQTDYAPVARAGDGTLIVAYLPTGRTVTVDMRRLDGPVTARWYDPTNGTFTVIGSDLANTGSRRFAPPAGNSAGDGDFVLVLQTGGPGDVASATGSGTPEPSSSRATG